MTNQQAAVLALLAAVEAGEWDDIDLAFTAFHNSAGNAVDVRHAYNGSLDADLSLHEAIVPEWHVTHAWGNSKDGWSWCLSRPANADRKARYVEGKSTYAAIALLIAILAAYAVQLEDPKDINIEHTEEVAK
jgi:hypothetical protein